MKKMKKIIGYILLALLFVFLYAGQALIFTLLDCHWAVSAFVPLTSFVLTALIYGFVSLVVWLID